MMYVISRFETAMPTQTFTASGSFVQISGGSVLPTAMSRNRQAIVIFAQTAAVNVSFDGTNTAFIIPSNDSLKIDCNGSVTLWVSGGAGNYTELQ